MKMTDVITGLREVNPTFQEAFALLSVEVDKLVELAKDNDSSYTLEGRKALGSALILQAMIVKTAYNNITKNVKELDDIVKSYTRKFSSEGSYDGMEGPTGPSQPEFDFTGSGADDPSEADGETVVERVPDRDAFIPQ